MIICILRIIACIEHPVGMLRSVDNNDATTPRIPLGMRPIGGCIPTACKEWGCGIFLPSDASLTGCCNSEVDRCTWIALQARNDGAGIIIRNS